MRIVETMPKGGLAGDHQPSYGVALLLAGVLLAAGLCAATPQTTPLPAFSIRTHASGFDPSSLFLRPRRHRT